mmetsp:Transcript_69806/g.160473  ORF Transcript_69806/g.160473 Transcript_69806/m.160473 type:complete len:136 (+) Transcript_69806:429-836(+)
MLVSAQQDSSGAPAFVSPSKCLDQASSCGTCVAGLAAPATVSAVVVVVVGHGGPPASFGSAGSGGDGASCAAGLLSQSTRGVGAARLGPLGASEGSVHGVATFHVAELAMPAIKASGSSVDESARAARASNHVAH